MLRKLSGFSLKPDGQIPMENGILDKVFDGKKTPFKFHS